MSFAKKWDCGIFLALLTITLVLALVGCNGTGAAGMSLGKSSASSSSSVGFLNESAPSSSSTYVANTEPKPASFAYAGVPAYSGAPSVEVNNDEPFFTESDLQRRFFEEYAPLDAQRRCGQAFALVGRETMPTEERGSIGMIQPSGWHTVRYEWVDGKYLYNRCHLIGYQLTGENANERNLITGTRSLNVEGMLPYENRVAEYVEATGNHVLYRSTPIFEGDELVARGVLLEAQSVEDSGAGVKFCAWCYNVEPGVDIDYATGESRASATVGDREASGTEQSTAATQETLSTESSSTTQTDSDTGIVIPADVTYVMNTRSHIFHKPTCDSVDDMVPHNMRFFYGTRDQAIEEDFRPCKRCNP